MTPNLDEIRQRAYLATPAPWLRHGVIVRGPCTVTGRDGDLCCVSFFRHARPRAELDAEFIAHARTDVTTLCDEIERLRACEKEASTELHRLAQDLGLPDDGPMENRVGAVEMVKRLKAEVAHWKANHDEQCRRRFFVESAMSSTIDQLTPAQRERLHILADYDRLKAKNARLREVAQRVARRFQVVGRAVPQSEPGGMVVQSKPYCEACEQSQCDEWCLRAMAERALANGGAGGGE